MRSYTGVFRCISADTRPISIPILRNLVQHFETMVFGLKRLTSFALFFALITPSLLHAQRCFQIEVIDEESKWPIPLVELKTTSGVRLISDNAGNVAFDLPEFMGRETWLSVYSPGYEVKADGFGFRGVRVVPRPGEKVKLMLTRTSLARRVGRLTGSGLFSESQKLGLQLDWKDQGITGCDTVRVAKHNGKFHHVWGDTNMPHYPLGLFHTLSATSAVSPETNFQPPLKIRYDYVRGSNGSPRNVAKMPGEGPTWLGGLVSLPDPENNEQHLVAHYLKVRNSLEVYQTGLCVWNESHQRFEQSKVLWTKSATSLAPPVAPKGHALPWTDDNDKDWILFGDPFPFLKCAANYAAWSNPKAWIPINANRQLKTVSGDQINAHRGSIAWNDYRKKWICIFGQEGGDSSFLGEIWYCEADSPLGPWSASVKVLSHQNYSLYNPRINSEWTKPSYDFILFEGTYTTLFTKNASPTPRYEYNQILYRLDLNDVAGMLDK